MPAWLGPMTPTQAHVLGCAYNRLCPQEAAVGQVMPYTWATAVLVLQL